MVRLAENIRASEKSHEDGEELDILLPEFILVLRDFNLDLNWDGKHITEDQYLENCLTIKKGVGESLAPFDELKSYLRKFFKYRKCLTMAHPGDSALQGPKSNTSYYSSETFKKDLEKFLDYVHKNVKPLTFENGRPINGRGKYFIMVYWSSYLSINVI